MRKVLVLALVLPIKCGASDYPVCKRPCVIEDVDFSNPAQAIQHSRYEMVLGDLGNPVPERLPLPKVGYAPAILQKYTSVVIDSKGKETYRARADDISEVNECISSKQRICTLPAHGRTFESGDVMTLEFDLQYQSAYGLARFVAVSFLPKLHTRVVLRNFNGSYLASGAVVKKDGASIVFEASGDAATAGSLIASEVPSWQYVAEKWPATANYHAVDDVAKEIFREVGRKDEAIRIAREWVSKNITYQKRWLTIADLWSPPDLSGVLASRKADCKGMVTLLEALLANQGIRSEVVLTRLDSENKKLYLFDPGIPMPGYFDHVLIYVPDLKQYFDATVRADQLDVEITEYMSFGLNTKTGELSCFQASDCKGVARYRLPQ
ncbi:MAG: transglutaminase domain-containing protein [Thermomonas sp.]|uniref:transglutaminase domain-containing protein n=1 Tax=Thermomonas sp. TaxID=1971895 RepID=UPI0039E3D7F0